MCLLHPRVKSEDDRPYKCHCERSVVIPFSHCEGCSPWQSLENTALASRDYFVITFLVMTVEVKRLLRRCTPRNDGEVKRLFRRCTPRNDD